MSPGVYDMMNAPPRTRRAEDGLRGEGRYMAVGTVSVNKLKAHGDKRDAANAADTDLSSGYHLGRIYSSISQQHVLKRLLKCVSFVLSPSSSVPSLCDAALLSLEDAPVIIRLSPSRRPSVSPFVSVRLPLCLLGSGHQNIFRRKKTKQLLLK